MPLVRGLARTAAIAGTATAVSNRVSRRQGQRWAQQEEQAYPPQQSYQEPPPPPPQQAAQTDVIEQLKQLGELRQQGVLTEEEFTRQKTKLLG
jgi:putative oligomerization/nucleic acid binding protein